MSDKTPLLTAEIEALAKIIAQQPHAQRLKNDFDVEFREACSQVRLERTRQRKVRRWEDCPEM